MRAMKGSCRYPKLKAEGSPETIAFVLTYSSQRHGGSTEIVLESNSGTNRLNVLNDKKACAAIKEGLTQIIALKEQSGLVRLMADHAFKTLNWSLHPISA